MPLTIAFPSERSGADLGERTGRSSAMRDRAQPIQIGLVNNMPDSALQATQRQFASLLEQASGQIDVRLALFNLESFPRDASTREAIANSYRVPNEHHARGLDAIIFTGAEPVTPNLVEAPYWDELAALMDWAKSHTVSNLYSCLAAHAAVLLRDGIPRRRRPFKLSGVFVSEVVAPHELVDGMGACFDMPHSRYNDLDEADLADKGYVVLARSRDGGVDLLVKEDAALEVFLQGHPEYEADTLAREYRRDFIRHRLGESANPPKAPMNYWAPEVSSRVASLMENREPVSIENVAEQLRPEKLGLSEASWRASSSRLFGNWLEAIARRKFGAGLDLVDLAATPSNFGPKD